MTTERHPTKVVLLDTSPTSKKKEGFWQRFPEPKPIQNAIEDFLRNSPEQTTDKALVAFALEKLQIQIPDASEIRRLLAGEPVFSVLAQAVRRLLPELSFQTVINRKYHVSFPEASAIRKAYAIYTKENPKISTFKIPQYFIMEILGISRGPKSLEKLLSGQPVSAPLAEAVLRRWPLQFELKVAKTGPPPKSKLMRRETGSFLVEDMRRTGARIGFIPFGAADRFLLGSIKDTLAYENIPIAQIKYLSPRDLNRRTSGHLHFIVNACLPNFNSPEINLVTHLYAVPLVLYISTSASENGKLPNWGKRCQIAVIEDSPEHLLGRALRINNLVTVGGCPPGSDYELLADSLAAGRYEAALANSYSFQRPLYLEGQRTTGARIVDQSPTDYNPWFRGYRYFPAHAFFDDQGRQILDPWRPVLRVLYPANIWHALIGIVTQHPHGGLGSMFSRTGFHAWSSLKNNVSSDLCEESRGRLRKSGIDLSCLGHVKYRELHGLPRPKYKIDCDSVCHLRNDPPSLPAPFYFDAPNPQVSRHIITALD